MADKIDEHELAVEKTEGFKVGEKKTLDEYLKLGECVINAWFYFLRYYSLRMWQRRVLG